MGPASVTDPDLVHDSRSFAVVTQPCPPPLRSLHDAVAPSGVLGITVAFKFIGVFSNWNTYPGNAMVDYFANDLGRINPFNEAMNKHFNQWVTLSGDYPYENFMRRYFGEASYRGTAAIVLQSQHGFPVRVALSLANAPEEFIKTSHARSCIEAVNDTLPALCQTEPVWQLRRERPAIDSLTWGSLILSWRGLAYEFHHEVLGISKSKAKRLREKLALLYHDSGSWGRQAHVLARLSHGGILQPWHLDPFHVRFFRYDTKFS